MCCPLPPPVESGKKNNLAGFHDALLHWKYYARGVAVMPAASPVVLHALQRLGEGVIKVKKTIKHPVLRVEKVVVGITSIPNSSNHTVGTSAEAMTGCGSEAATGLDDALGDFVLLGCHQCGVELSCGRS